MRKRRRNGIKKSRAKNIIVQGVTEPEVKNEENLAQLDKDFTNNLLKDVQIDIAPKSIQRIGKSLPMKSRPIKIILNSAAKKVRLMKQLKNLKGKQEYLRISITNDLTPSERALYKSWKDKADEKDNDESLESGYKWKVRGTLKSGLYLKKVLHSDTQ